MNIRPWLIRLIIQFGATVLANVALAQPTSAPVTSPLEDAQTIEQARQAMQEAEARTPDWLKQQASVFARNTIRADGKASPALIPFGVAAETAFFGLANEVDQASSFRQKLRQRFGGDDADLGRVTELAANAHAFAEKVRNDEVRGYDLACEKVVTAEPWNSIDPVATAREFQGIENARMRLIEEHYRAAIDELSASVRSALLRYIDADIRPQIRWSTLDNVGVATEIPIDWLYNKRLTCERWLASTESERVWRVVPPQPQTAR